MSTPDHAGGTTAAGARAPTPGELVIGDRLLTIERPTALKASRALAMLRALSRQAPDLQAELARFRRQYERENVLELDRVQAKLRFPPRPLTERDPDGREVAVLDETGAPRMLPSPVDRLTEADWEAAGGLYRMPASPSGVEVAVALLDKALEAAEDSVYRFLALFTIPNRELKEARRGGRDDALILERAEELLEDVYADELLELAVVVAETVDGHFRRKADELGGDRLGKALRLIGLGPMGPSSPNGTAPSSPRPSSSTASPASTDGAPMTSSTPHTSSSPSSEASSNGTASSPSSPSSRPPETEAPA